MEAAAQARANTTPELLARQRRALKPTTGAPDAAVVTNAASIETASAASAPETAPAAAPPSTASVRVPGAPNPKPQEYTTSSEAARAMALTLAALAEEKPAAAREASQDDRAVLPTSDGHAEEPMAEKATGAERDLLLTLIRHASAHQPEHRPSFAEMVDHLDRFEHQKRGN